MARASLQCSIAGIGLDKTVFVKPTLNKHDDKVLAEFGGGYGRPTFGSLHGRATGAAADLARQRSLAVSDFAPTIGLENYLQQTIVNFVAGLGVRSFHA
jgi:hypothetical protein